MKRFNAGTAGSGRRLAAGRGQRPTAARLQDPGHHGRRPCVGQRRHRVVRLRRHRLRRKPAHPRQPLHVAGTSVGREPDALGVEQPGLVRGRARSRGRLAGIVDRAGPDPGELQPAIGAGPAGRGGEGPDAGPLPAPLVPARPAGGQRGVGPALCDRPGPVRGAAEREQGWRRRPGAGLDRLFATRRVPDL